ncbi:glycoprotein-N-acetylgalactosamine 3-beta-galactosyltransferase 1-like isoform X2 [Neocloeon triangulifer]|nr:glycoprotein-N-acetylgalactosamine 3-beta-galactosyltransferase 1-like isoform X2 [Neocloeon triangulifer]
MTSSWKSTTYARGPKLFLTFLIGFCLGIVVPSLSFVSLQTGNVIPLVKKSEQQDALAKLKNWLQLNSSFAVDLLKETREVEARRTAEKTRIFCLVMDDFYHPDRVNASRDTWGRHCNKLVFFNKLKVKFGKTNMTEKAWSKTLHAFRYINKYHLYSFEWFLKVDDKTFVLVENLRRSLATQDHQSIESYGFHFNSFGSMQNGTGFVLSREAVRLVSEATSNGSTKCKGQDEIVKDDDAEIYSCLQRMKMDPLNIEGEVLSFNMANARLPEVKGATWWMDHYKYWPYHKNNDSLVPTKIRSACCQQNIFAFQEVDPNKMYLLEYLIYDVQVFGAPLHVDGLFKPPKPPISAIKLSENSTTASNKSLISKKKD